MSDYIDDFEDRMAEYRPGEWSNPFDEVGCPVCGRDVVSWVTPSSAFGTSEIELAGTPDHCQRGATMFFHEANVEIETLYGMHITGDTDSLGDGDALFRHTSMPQTTESMSNTNTQAPLADGATVHIQTDDPMLVTRAGTTYRAWDVEDGDPVGDPWVLTEGAVRGLLRRHDWTRVEATASVRGADDE